MTLNKHLAALYVVAACIFGCKEPAPNKASDRKGGAAPPETDTMMSSTDTIEPVQVASWQAFEGFDGKYVMETGMLNREPLKTRIKTLLGEGYTTFIERFEVTPPVELENEVLYNQGCRKHDCGSDEAAIAIDMRRDVIYVGITTSGSVKLYSENNDPAFPEKIMRWKRKFPALK
jgi:hypothetical protein